MSEHTPELSDDLKRFRDKIANQTPAKRELMWFLKTTPVGGEYRFEIQGNKQAARAFVNRMRVHLSRMRAEVEGARKHFKILADFVAHPSNAGIIIIVLRRSVNDTNSTAEAVDMIFNEIAIKKA